MILFVYCDEDEHPIAEAETMTELAHKVGLTPNAVYNGFKRKHSRTYVQIDTDEDEKDE